MSKKKICINVNSPEGNIFFILAKAAECLSNEEVVEMTSKAIQQKSYVDAIKVISQYVEVELV